MINSMIMGSMFTVWASSPMNCFTSNPPFTTKRKNKYIKTSKRESSFSMTKLELSHRRPGILQLYSQKATRNQRSNNYQITHFQNRLIKQMRIIYNNKMEISEAKALDFFNHYFQCNNQFQTSFDNLQDISYISPFPSWGLDFKSHRNPSINFPKPIKQYGFIKKYDIICNAIPFVSALRPDQLQTNDILAIIKSIYDNYLSFVKMGLWKAKQPQIHFQQFLLLLLHEIFNKPQLRIKKKHTHFDRFVLSFVYTLNILKTCSKHVKVFANFLSSSSSFGELFLYLCFKNIAVIEGRESMINSNIMKKIVKVFQGDDQQHNISISLSRQSIDFQEGKMVNINSIFIQPITGSLSIPKVKLYKIMKICKIVDCDDQKQGVEWGHFLRRYFEMVEQNQICYDHIVCAAVAKSTFELSTKLLAHQKPQLQQQFIQEAFGYVFEILQVVQAQREPQIEHELTGKNIQSLRKHYQYMKTLNEYNVTIMNKFAKKILKNNFILELYKKYVQN